MEDKNRDNTNEEMLKPEDIKLNMSEDSQIPDTDPKNPSQTGKWSGNPRDEVMDSGKPPKVEPKNMPGDTDVQSETIKQRY